MSDGEGPEGPRLISIRTMDIVVALLMLGAAAVVISDSLRLGMGWQENEGPRAGYFPFYIGCLLTFAGLYVTVETLLRWKKIDTTFVTRERLKPVLLMLFPSIAFVVLIAWLGIYVASFLYIGAFMLWQGKYGWLPALGVSAGLPIVLFLVFEKWFLVPLPKGPIEHLLGF